MKIGSGGRLRSGLRALAGAVGLGLLAYAVVRELRLPASERTWHGRLFGRVPYELRPPTLARVKAAVWRPDDPALLVPTAFGVGWTINVGSLLRGGEARRSVETEAPMVAVG